MTATIEVPVWKLIGLAIKATGVREVRVHFMHVREALVSCADPDELATALRPLLPESFRIEMFMPNAGGGQILIKAAQYARLPDWTDERLVSEEQLFSLEMQHETMCRVCKGDGPCTEGLLAEEVRRLLTKCAQLKRDGDAMEAATDKVIADLRKSLRLP